MDNSADIAIDFFDFKLWGAARAYYINEYDKLLNEIASVSEEAITYLHVNRKKIWSRSKFGTTSKCDYITNNISEVFNSWVVAFTAFTRDNNRDKYIDPYFTVEKFKEAYALEIGPLPTKDQWVHMETKEKIYAPIIKRPIGRPRKNKIGTKEELSSK
ncbi:hypothetical protein CTI12_AA303320 [Artemisia annua]|uniref:Uncharacterized protein n=1 Tax=Artemisia annua TaxID=35608 RepID=A0A2U1N5V3_ARTAN|nr:hypothetical protein CTI12_AA303320 [Artemisia annua]